MGGKEVGEFGVVGEGGGGGRGMEEIMVVGMVMMEYERRTKSQGVAVGVSRVVV